MSTEAMKLQEIMTQAQVFASAWSHVGGRFDGGNAMDEAEVAKNELHQMVAEALAQPQQEPVAWRWKHGDSCWQLEDVQPRSPTAQPLYTSPPARKPLTDEEIRAIVRKVDEKEGHIIHFAQAIEAAHGIKENT